MHKTHCYSIILLHTLGDILLQGHEAGKSPLVCTAQEARRRDSSSQAGAHEVDRNLKPRVSSALCQRLSPDEWIAEITEGAWELVSLARFYWFM